MPLIILLDDILIMAASKFFYKYEKIDSPAYTVDRIFGNRDNLSGNDSTASQREERSNYNSVLDSYREVICNNKGTDPAGRSSVLNSSCNSLFISEVLCNSKLTKNGIGQRQKLGNTNRRGQGIIEVVDSKSAFDKVSL